jgi:HicB family
MDLNEYAAALQRELLAMTRFAGEDVSRTAQMLAESLDSAVRLALLDLLSAAADEITSRLDGALIEVRLSGSQPEFVVTVNEPAEPEPTAEPDEAGQARLTLRMPEGLKSRAEAAAAASGISVNAWLVRAVQRALDQPSGRGTGPRVSVGKRYTGFARS